MWSKEKSDYRLDSVNAGGPEQGREMVLLVSSLHTEIDIWYETSLLRGVSPNNHLTKQSAVNTDVGYNHPYDLSGISHNGPTRGTKQVRNPATWENDNGFSQGNKSSGSLWTFSQMIGFHRWKPVTGQLDSALKWFWQLLSPAYDRSALRNLYPQIVASICIDTYLCMHVCI